MEKQENDDTENMAILYVYILYPFFLLRYHKISLNC